MQGQELPLKGFYDPAPRVNCLVAPRGRRAKEDALWRGVAAAQRCRGPREPPMWRRGSLRGALTSVLPLCRVGLVVCMRAWARGCAVVSA